MSEATTPAHRHTSAIVGDLSITASDGAVRKRKTRAPATVWVVHPHSDVASDDRDVFVDEATAETYVAALGIEATIVEEPVLTRADADRMIAAERARTA